VTGSGSSRRSAVRGAWAGCRFPPSPGAGGSMAQVASPLASAANLRHAGQFLTDLVSSSAAAHR
jgi:hypothetical protein